jgi:hypothetical protein
MTALPGAAARRSNKIKEYFALATITHGTT